MATKTCDKRLASMKTAHEAKGGIAGLYHANISVLNHDTLEDAMEHPEKCPNLTVRVSSYAVGFARLTREQRFGMLSRTFHTGK